MITVAKSKILSVSGCVTVIVLVAPRTHRKYNMICLKMAKRQELYPFLYFSISLYKHLNFIGHWWMKEELFNKPDMAHDTEAVRISLQWVADMKADFSIMISGLWLQLAWKPNHLWMLDVNSLKWVVSCRQLPWKWHLKPASSPNLAATFYTQLFVFENRSHTSPNAKV